MTTSASSLPRAAELGEAPIPTGSDRAFYTALGAMVLPAIEAVIEAAAR
jgi:hypothetical protein